MADQVNSCETKTESKYKFNKSKMKTTKTIRTKRKCEKKTENEKINYSKNYLEDF